MKVLCELTDWETHEVNRGRSVGKPIKTRRVIGANKWCWVVGTQYEHRPEVLIDPQYFGNMTKLLENLPELFPNHILKEDLLDKINKIVYKV